VAKLTSQDYAVRRMLVKILDTVTPSLRDLAHKVGVSYGAMRQYRLGTRTPSPKVLRALIAALRKHSGQVARLADELEAASKRR
jgi:transcriptional regulator with XRE-family HTH domain